ncbi:MAG: MoaD/ThiS family protein [Planctomycetales bacterium]|nr:MoaD/ThiS family protein [Planctomycetales bacterium]
MTTVEIPAALRRYIGGRGAIELTARTPQDVLDELENLYPQLYQCVCNETGSVRPHVNLFVNSTLIRTELDFAKPLESGDVIGIFQAVSGG